MRFCTLLLALMCSAFICGPICAEQLSTSSSSVTVVVDRDSSECISRLGLGATLIRPCLDEWGTTTAAATRALEFLEATCRWQNMQVMGWGLGNPEPMPGVFDWSGLDDRMKLVGRSEL